ncbi:MAG: hypothetical protein R2865_12040 [Deinococcales bacterium]
MRIAEDEEGFYQISSDISDYARLQLYDLNQEVIIGYEGKAPKFESLYLAAQDYYVELGSHSPTPYHLQFIPSQAPETGFEARTQQPTSRCPKSHRQTRNQRQLCQP